MQHITELLKKELNKAYVAGIIDGEGCIGIEWKKNKNRSDQYLVKVSVSNTDVKLMNWLKGVFGGAFYKHKNHFPEKHKTRYEWKLSCSKARDFLINIRPYLQLKKHQADTAIVLQNMLDEGRGLSAKNGIVGQQRSNKRTNLYHNCYLQMREFNQKGRPQRLSETTVSTTEATV